VPLGHRLKDGQHVLLDDGNQRLLVSHSPAVSPASIPGLSDRIDGDEAQGVDGSLRLGQCKGQFVLLCLRLTTARRHLNAQLICHRGPGDNRSTVAFRVEGTGFAEVTQPGSDRGGIRTQHHRP
jgi:hypothetical protein